MAKPELTLADVARRLNMSPKKLKRKMDNLVKDFNAGFHFTVVKSNRGNPSKEK